MTKYKLSLHSHTSNFAHLVMFNPNKIEYLTELIGKLSKIKGHIVLGISNFNDDERYQALLETTKLLSPLYKIDTTYSDYFFSIIFNKKQIFFVKTDEIETERGHILIIGFKGKVQNRNLNEIIKKARKQKCVIIANHPLHFFGTSYFLVKKIFGKPEISLSKKDIEKHKKDFDALELNSYFPEDWNKVKKLSIKDKIPLVSDSDAHFLNEIFTSWYEVDNLNFSNPKRFKKSLKKQLKKGIHIHAAKYGYAAKYKHSLQVALEIIGKKIHLIKE